jgi:CHASE2 domain-containing sensor protein
MTTPQQTKIAELLVAKLNAAHKQPYEEILPPSVKANQIHQKMVLAGVVYELMRDAFNYSFLNDDDNDFDNFLNNLK